jgi:hypothetical protein
MNMDIFSFVTAAAIGFLAGWTLRRGSAEAKTSPKAQTQPKSKKGKEESSEPLKMVIAVRMDLKMTTGKIASQVGHAG